MLAGSTKCVASHSCERNKALLLLGGKYLGMGQSLVVQIERRFQFLYMQISAFFAARPQLNTITRLQPPARCWREARLLPRIRLPCESPSVPHSIALMAQATAGLVPQVALGPIHPIGKRGLRTRRKQFGKLRR
jgi:hypothetical protein